ncbi:MAG: hypothetical protein IPG32_20490 [Saprospirales bacterium]|nr:hypothetical protein [Saprospirales bacterium]
MYPFLQFFWFTPKSLLINGKMYILFKYIDFIFSCVKRWKLTLSYLIVLFLVGFLFAISNSEIIRILAIIVATFFYVKFIWSYSKSGFKETRILGKGLTNSLFEYKLSFQSNDFKILKQIEENPKDDKLNPGELRKKKTKNACQLLFSYSTCAKKIYPDLKNIEHLSNIGDSE